MSRLALFTGLALALLAAPAARAQDDALARSLAFQRLMQQYVTLKPQPFRASAEQLQAWRDELRPQLDALIDNAQRLVADQPDPDALLLLSLAHARRANLILDQRRALDREVAAIGADQADPDLLHRRAAVALDASQEYRRIYDNLEAALRGAEDLRARREVGLIRGVVLAQTSIVENAAITAAEDAGSGIEFDPAELRAFLDDAEALLQSYLEQTPREHGLEWVRGRFYLGVVQYRRTLKPREPGTEYFTEYDPEQGAALEEATDIFTELADPDAVLAILQPHATEELQRTSPAGMAYEASSFRGQANYSYEAVAGYYAAAANLYLGLLAAIGPDDHGGMEGRYAAVEGHLNQARDLDQAPPQPEEPPISLTAGTIPLSYDRVLTELAAAREAPAAGQPLHDLTFTIGTGYLWDTNVSLLGDRTTLPREISSKSDSRFPNTFRISYIVDGGALAPENSELSKWQFFAEGRVTSTWNGSVTAFNEQIYGGTLNFRRELIGPDVAENLDALLMHVRYDYDHIVLGNDGFLGINRVRPMLQLLAYEARLDASLFFSWEGRDYSEFLADPRFNRDGDYMTFGADLRLDLGDALEGSQLWGPELAWGGYGPREDDPDFRRPTELNFAYEHTINSTLGDEFDYSSNVFSAGLAFPLPLGIDLTLGGLWEWQEYWQHSIVDRQRRYRRGLVQEYAVGLERKFYLTDYQPDYAYIEPLRLDRVVLSLRGEMRFIEDDNNVVDRLGQTPFEYDRALYGIGLRLEVN